MIYLLCIILIICGEWRWAILALRLYKEVKRINKQEEFILPYPCRKCGEYPKYETIRISEKVPNVYAEFGTHIEWYSELALGCCNKVTRKLYKGCKTMQEWENRILIKIWNKSYGTLDELELKMIREGITN